MSRLALACLTFPLCAAAAQEHPPAPHQLLVAVAPTESLRVTIAGEGEPVVLLPGLFGSAFGYRHLLALLPAAGFRALVIEPLGIGGSPRPHGADYSLTAQAERVATVLAALGESPAVVVGHSVNASLALRLAWRHPEAVRAVVALDGGAADEAATPGFRRAMRYAPWVKWLGGIRRIRPMMRRELVAASGDSSWVTEEVMDAYTEAARADLDGTLLAFLAMADARERDRLTPALSEIRCPVYLVVGTAPHRGGVEERAVRVMRERLGSLEVDTIGGAGQYLFEEQPEALAALIGGIARRGPATLGSAR